MKKNAYCNFNLIIPFIITIICLNINLFGGAIIYPVPAGIPLNPDFTVRINDGSGFVNVPVQDIVDVCFAHFAMSGSVDVEITVSQPIATYKLSPLSLNIQSIATGNKLTFTLTQPEKLIILINAGAGNHTTGLDGLCIIADSLEVNPPKLGDANVVNIMNYGVDNTGTNLNTTQIQKAFNDNAGLNKIIFFPVGIYKSGLVHLRSNESLYLAPGATLLGSSNFADYAQIPGEGNPNEKYLLGSWMSNNLKVFGRGIVNGNGTALRTQDSTGVGFRTHNIQFMGAVNVTIQDIVSLNSSSWNLEENHCDSLIINNVKVMNDLRYYPNADPNTDGIDINKCQHVLVENCLVWAGDDAISPKLDVSNNMFAFRDVFDHTYKNMVVYTRRSAVKIGSETLDSNYVFYDLTFDNIDVVIADRTICIWSENGALINNITFQNIRIEQTGTEFDQNHINCHCNTVGNSIRNVNIINLSALGPAPKGSVFNGNNLLNLVNEQVVQYSNIHFNNYTIGGQVVLSLTNALAAFTLNSKVDKTAFTFEGPSGIVSSTNNPKTFELYNNYPNPFNPSTIIRYQLSTFGKVLLKVYDVLGREVVTLVNKEQEAGEYEAIFNADASYMSSLSSGIYFYQLRDGNYTVTKKMVLMK
jgi:hypothetical protein